MSLEKDFDRIIKQKLQKENFPFDENNWLHAKEMINAQRASQIVEKGYAINFTSFFSILAILGTIGIIGFYSYDQLEQKNKLLSHTTDIISQKNVSTLSVQSNQNEIAQKTKNINSNASSDISDNNLIKTANLPANVTTFKNQPLYLKIEGESLKRSASLKSNSISEAASKAKLIEYVASYSNNQPIQSKQYNKLIASNSTAPINFNNTVQDGNGFSNLEETQLGASTAKPLESKFISEGHNQAFNNQVAYLCKIEITNTLIDTAIFTTPITLPKVYENGSITNSEKKSRFFNVGSGINYVTGWLNASQRDGNGLNYYINANYGFYISKELAIGAGLDFYNLQNIKQAFYTQTKTEYAFGSNNVYYTVRANNLSYLALPLKLYMDVNHVLVVSAGVLPSILLSSSNEIETYKMIDGQKVTQSLVRNKLNYEGIEQKNVQLTIGFEVKLTKKISLSTELNYGLTDIFKNNMSNKALQKVNGIRLGINYNLSNK
jgi:hypothetical protein